MRIGEIPNSNVAAYSAHLCATPLTKQDMQECSCLENVGCDCNSDCMQSVATEGGILWQRGMGMQCSHDNPSFLWDTPNFESI